VVYAAEIREMMLEPTTKMMVQGETRGGKGSRRRHRVRERDRL